jgi:hypothetical protein
VSAAGANDNHDAGDHGYPAYPTRRSKPSLCTPNTRQMRLRSVMQLTARSASAC